MNRVVGFPRFGPLADISMVAVGLVYFCES